MKFTPLFSINDLDRLSHLRDGEKLPESTNSCYLLFSEGELLVDGENRYFFPKVEDSLAQHQEKIFLGRIDDRDYFALWLKGYCQETLHPVNLRSFPLEHALENETTGIIAQAVANINWHHSHQFCGQCGGLTQSAQAGWRRDCLDCDKQHFPRIDPVVIMLVTRGDECLLGSGVLFPERRYSCLAGFMEPGETIEATAARELFEEAGIYGDKAQYLLSQPWPFPHTLMIGVHITTQAKTLTMAKEELADLKWVTKTEVKRLLQDDSDPHVQLPPQTAIARSLLEYWIEA